MREIAGDAALRRSYVDMLRDFYAKDVKHRDDGTVIRGGDMAERFQGDNAWTPDRVAGNFYGYVSAQEALAQPEPWRLPTHTAVLVNRDKAQAVGEAWIRTPDTLIPITQW
ncbi:MAG: hypothetical protein CL556_10705, partial [Alphaproteobacteria bacterium]|nr:hypothetical protein [Alphaproteobacteria bacterium]